MLDVTLARIACSMSQPITDDSIRSTFNFVGQSELHRREYVTSSDRTEYVTS